MYTRRIRRRLARWLRYVITIPLVTGALLLAASCHETLTEPATSGPAPLPRRDAVGESPAAGSVSLSVDHEAPLAGADTVVGHYPTTTIVAMTAHQRFAMATRPPHPPGTGMLGLAGRGSAFGCSHQGEAYLVSYPDAGGYAFPFAGCQLGADVLIEEYTDTVAVSGWVKWGYSYDAGCPYPDLACTEYTGSSSVTLSRLAASLTLTADRAEGGVVKVHPKRPSLFYAVPAPAQLGRHRTPVQPTEGAWTFTPDSGAVREHVCDNGDGLTCEATVGRSGTLTLVALVNGVRMISAPLRVEVPTLTLSLSADSVGVGDTVIVTTTLTGAYADRWWFYAVAPAANAIESTGPGPGGLPPCLTARPVPMRCYIVFDRAGAATVFVGGVFDDDVSRFTSKPITVTASSTPTVVVRASSRALLGFSRHIPAGKCSADDAAMTRRFHVAVVDEATHAQLPDRTVTLALSAVAPADPKLPDDGGHVLARHLGIGKPPGRLSATTVVTDANGDAYVTYDASEFGGKYEVRGGSPGARAGADTITVGVALLPLGTGSHYALIGQTPEHPVNHYGTPTMNGRLDSLANALHADRGIDLEYNDVALPLGGRFEVADGGHPTVDWTNPAHCDHRFGRGADLRTNSYQTGYTNENPSPTVLLMISRWHQLNTDWPRDTSTSGKPSSRPYFWEGDHLHLKTVR